MKWKRKIKYRLRWNGVDYGTTTNRREADDFYENMRADERRRQKIDARAGVLAQQRGRCYTDSTGCSSLCPRGEELEEKLRLVDGTDAEDEVFSEWMDHLVECNEGIEDEAERQVDAEEGGNSPDEEE